MRSVRTAKDPAPATASRSARVSSACAHMACSSDGGPGRTTIVGPSPDAGADTRPGAVPTGSSTVAPTGTSACLRVPSRHASMSRFGKRCSSGSSFAAIRPCSGSSSARSRPWNAATTSIVRSSAVGPRPPLVITSATPCDASHSRAPRMSSGRSPTTTVVSWSTPSSVSRSASHGPFASRTRPLSTSVPVMTMPARGMSLMGRTGSLGGFEPGDLATAADRVADGPVRRRDRARAAVDPQPRLAVAEDEPETPGTHASRWTARPAACGRSRACGRRRPGRTRRPAPSR